MRTRRDVLLASGALLATHRVFAADAAMVEMQTLAYTRVDGKELLLDLYRPVQRTQPLPVIVFVHGGGWQRGTRTTGPDFKRFFAQDGFAVASIDYRLTPSITFPSNVEDVRTSVRWLRANAQRFGLDGSRIALWGTSAGGHLAAVAALAPPRKFAGRDHEELSSDVQCVHTDRQRSSSWIDRRRRSGRIYMTYPQCCALRVSPLCRSRTTIQALPNRGCSAHRSERSPTK
jgi:acetyl esterase/lipase